MVFSLECKAALLTLPWSNILVHRLLVLSELVGLVERPLALITLELAGLAG